MDHVMSIKKWGFRPPSQVTNILTQDKIIAGKFQISKISSICLPRMRAIDRGLDGKFLQVSMVFREKTPNPPSFPNFQSIQKKLTSLFFLVSLITYFLTPSPLNHRSCNQYKAFCNII